METKQPHLTVLGERVNSSPIPPAEREWANGLLKRLNRRSPVRTLITEILSGERQELPVEFLKSVLNDRSPKMWRERALAAWALAVFPLETHQVHDATILLSDLLAGRIAHDRFAAGCGLSYAIGICICFCATVATIIANQSLNGGVDWMGMIGTLVFVAFGCAIVGLPVGVAIGSLVIPIYVVRDKRRLNYIRAAAAKSLSRMATPHAISALAGAAKDGDKTVRETSLESLRTHLPRVTEKHYGSLRRDTIPGLCGLLNSTERKLQLEVLEALIKVGDGRALQPVDQLYSTTQDEEVQKVCLRAIAVLTVRAENEKSAELLLRSSAAPSDQSATLLRPAGASTEHDEAQLLRAILANEEG